MSNKKIKGNINQIMMVKDCKKIKNSKDLIKILLKLKILYKEKSETNTLKIQYTNISLQFLSKDLMESTILAQEEVLLFHRPLHRIIFMPKIHIHNRYFYLGLVFRNSLSKITYFSFCISIRSILMCSCMLEMSQEAQQEEK